MMNSRKEEERNEKIIRGLLKLPPNRKCINCNNSGPQYVCTNFWTFICVACSGIHREFTHRVKSISMSKFSKQEVEALQNGGNQRAKDIFLKCWDTQQMRFPESKNPDKVREFIRNVYVEKQYASEKCFHDPPEDAQDLRNNEDHRRASSYHSFSQSPPYDSQYEDRRYGKKPAMLTRKPGSERVHSEGRVSSLVYSSGSVREQMHEDRFAREPGSRVSDVSDTFISSSQKARVVIVEEQKPNVLEKYSDTNIRGNNDGILQSKITSLGRSGFPGSNSVSLESIKSRNLVDIVLDSDPSSIGHHNKTIDLSLSQKPPISMDSIDSPSTKKPVSQDIDLFAEMNTQASYAVTVKEPTSFPLQENVGWATFDLPHYSKSSPELNAGSPPPPCLGGELIQNVPVPNLVSHDFFQPIAKQWPTGPNDAGADLFSESFQGSNHSGSAFDRSADNISFSLVDSILENNELFAMHNSLLSDSFTGTVSQKYPQDGCQHLVGVNVTPPVDLPFFDMSGSSIGAALAEMGENIQPGKGTNPFDLSYDPDIEPNANGLFLNMSSLQVALAAPELPSDFVGSLPSPFYFQNSVNTFASHLSQAYVEVQASSSQLTSIPSQGPSIHFSGNPFA